MAKPLTIMSPTVLVRAVTAVTQQKGEPVATGREIYAWCAANNVDWGEFVRPKGKHFWEADHANAPSILRKFKIEPLTHVGQNAWCLADRWKEACAWTTKQSPRWRAIPWDATRRNWMWKCAERVDGTVAPFSTFDVQALARCQASVDDSDDYS